MCPAGQSSAAGSSFCFNCHYSCGRCSSFSATACLSCAQLFAMDPEHGLCAPDTDGDGVPDSIDKCDAAPYCMSCVGNKHTSTVCRRCFPGFRRIKKVCTLDTDADGVPDSVDPCKLAPYCLGCSTPTNPECTSCEDKYMLTQDGHCARDWDSDGVPDFKVRSALNVPRSTRLGVPTAQAYYQQGGGRAPRLTGSFPRCALSYLQPLVGPLPSHPALSEVPRGTTSCIHLPELHSRVPQGRGPVCAGLAAPGPTEPVW
jgi:hypothetical protein